MSERDPYMNAADMALQTFMRCEETLLRIACALERISDLLDPATRSRLENEYNEQRIRELKAAHRKSTD